MTNDQSISLLKGLVEIRSLSTEEKEASTWLVSQMQELGYARSFVDEAGSAVGEMGLEDAGTIIVCLGHIDTVPGEIPVRIEGDILHGRGSVDAKGPLASFVCAAAQLGHDWAVENDVRLIVAGAVEEEAATSKGARAVRDRLTNVDACIIGEPSRWDRVTLGYKGRIQIEFEASRTMAHTAGPERGIGADAAALWSHIEQHCNDWNEDKPKLFDQLMPNLRTITTDSGEGFAETVQMMISIRTPMNWDADAFQKQISDWVAARFDQDSDQESGALKFKGLEPAWRGERSSPAARAFLSAIRENEAKPGFVVKTGTCDMNVVGPAWNCPILAYGPGDSSLDHTPEERISLTEFLKSISVLEAALRRLPSLLKS